MEEQAPMGKEMRKTGSPVRWMKPLRFRISPCGSYAEMLGANLPRR
jgi:hypothetical protein